MGGVMSVVWDASLLPQVVIISSVEAISSSIKLKATWVKHGRELEFEKVISPNSNTTFQVRFY